MAAGGGRTPRLWLRALAGALLLAVAIAGVCYPLWWDHRSNTAGQVLLQRGFDPGGSSHGSGAGRCLHGSRSGPAVATDARPAVLEIPAIGLTAPVVNGMGTSVLDVAVGHDPATVWPGQAGESVLLAHDVSYFSGLSRLRAGDMIAWKLACSEVDFRVGTTEVTTPGANLPAPASGSGLALVTCWPTDALFWTSQRFVVEAHLVSVRTLSSPSKVPRHRLVHLKVPAPRALAAEGLALGQSGVFVGTLSIVGSPTSSFTEGPQPLAVERAALEDYAAAAKSAEAGNRSWWSVIAVPGVAIPAPWSTGYTTDVSLVVTGGTVERVVLSSQAATVTLTVRGDELLVTRVVPAA